MSNDETGEEYDRYVDAIARLVMLERYWKRRLRRKPSPMLMGLSWGEWQPYTEGWLPNRMMGPTS